MEYKEEEFLLLSGIQHFAFCPRQWALIHIEQQWKENYFTIDGNILHEKAHDQDKTEKRNNFLITRGMRVFSRTMGISGICDVVEFHKKRDGIWLQNYEGTYIPLPIEYKRGKPKANNADQLQLCAQAMCLEEMLVCEIKKGFLYYGEPKKRTQVLFDDVLKEQVTISFKKMHELFARKYTPKAKMTKACKSCSISDVCLPGLNKQMSASAYIKNMLREEER